MAKPKERLGVMMNEIMPVLSDGEIYKAYRKVGLLRRIFGWRRIAEAQRDADRKWMVKLLTKYGSLIQYTHGQEFRVDLPEKVYQALKEA